MPPKFQSKSACKSCGDEKSDGPAADAAKKGAKKGSKPFFDK